MKKIIAVLLAALMLLSLAACGEKAPTLNTEYTAEELMTKVTEQVRLPFATMVTPVQVSSEDSVYFLGLTESKGLVAEDAAVCEPMMMSQAFSTAIVKLNDVSDAETVKNEILEGVDMRKWICVEAEKLIVVENGQYVLMTMGPVDMVDAIAAAFDTILENENGTELVKEGAAAMPEGDMPADMIPDAGNEPAAFPG